MRIFQRSPKKECHTFFHYFRKEGILLIKKQLKLMSLLLSIALLLISAAPLTANAFDSIDADATVELITPSANAIICIPAKDASAELCQALNVMNIPTRDNTLIEVVPLSEEPNGTALIVKNANGAVLMNDIIISIESNGIISNILYSLFPSGSASTTNYGSITVPIPSYSNQLIHVTVEFKQPRSGNYYQPQSVHMIYYSNGGDVVTNVDIRYLCKGFVFSYPDMVEQSEDIYDIYTHEIPLFKSVPESNTVYAFSRPYRNDRVIYVSNAPGTGHGIDFFLYINGVRISDSVSF